MISALKKSNHKFQITFHRLLIAFTIFCFILTQPLLAQNQKQTHPGADNIFDELQCNTWYLPTSDHRAQLYVTSLGEKGPRIVCLHGGPGNDFNYLVKPLRSNRNRYRFVLFDQRGSLLSPVPDSMISNLSMDILVEDLETLRKALGLNQLILFGHSFGTYLALAYYIKYPKHVKAMILAASVPPFTSQAHTLTDVARNMSKAQRLLRQRPAVKQILHSQGLDSSNENKFTPQQASNYYKIDGLASFNIYQIAKWQQFEGGRVYFNAKVAQAIGNTMKDVYDIQSSLNSNPVPIYILQGDHDYLDPSASSWNYVREKYPSIHVMVLHNASHYSWIDDPVLFQQYFQIALKAVTRN